MRLATLQLASGHVSCRARGRPKAQATRNGIPAEGWRPMAIDSAIVCVLSYISPARFPNIRPVIVRRETRLLAASRLNHPPTLLERSSV